MRLGFATFKFRHVSLAMPLAVASERRCSRVVGSTPVPLWTWRAVGGRHRRKPRWQRAPSNEPTPLAGSKTFPGPGYLLRGQLFEAFLGRPDPVLPGCFDYPGIRVLTDLWASGCLGCSRRVTTGGWLAGFSRTHGTGYRSSACPGQPQRKACARRASVRSVYGSKATAS